MATLPDRTDLGRGIIPQGRAQTRVQFRGGEIAAEGIKQTAQTISAAVDHYAQQDDAFNFARARSAMLTADAGIRKQLETDQDWKTHEERYQSVMDTARQEAGNLISGKRSKALFDMEATADFQRGQAAIAQNARRVEGEWGRGELDNILDANRRAALESKDPAARASLIDASLDGIATSLMRGYIDPAQAANIRQSFTASYGEGYAEMLPDAERLAVLRKPKGTPADFIAPDKRAVMIERLEDKFQAVADRREAKAERAIGQIERQLSTGIPATPAMWNEWKRAVAGTSVQGDLNQLIAGEREVQATLRKPVAEQQRLVQERREALLTTGGSMADAANVVRLENAVKQNIALIKSNPLLYAEQRMQMSSEPVNVASVVDPDARPVFAAQLQDRAAQIKAVEKQSGTSVPMNLLLPQEAAQFAAILESGSSAQVSEFFASLRDASGSTDIYKGLVHQVAPDAPVKAMAGLLAAQQADLVTESNWFSPDKSVTSRDVAATLLEGERILRPSKADKAEDGNSKASKLMLPSAAITDLQSKFANEVGNVFAGRPDAADTAFQAAQAYYVGRASQLGQLAGDSQAVDAALVRESVRATLGNVVDYKGNGAVLAPWGMAEDDFEDRAERAFSAEAKRRGLSDEVMDDLSVGAFGLTNTDQEGVYAVTNGRGILRDKNRQPVMIDLKPRTARDARGYIDRSAGGGK